MKKAAAEALADEAEAPVVKKTKVVKKAAAAAEEIRYCCTFLGFTYTDVIT